MTLRWHYVDITLMIHWWYADNTLMIHRDYVDIMCSHRIAAPPRQPTRPLQSVATQTEAPYQNGGAGLESCSYRHVDTGKFLLQQPSDSNSDTGSNPISNRESILLWRAKFIESALLRRAECFPKCVKAARERGRWCEWFQNLNLAFIFFIFFLCQRRRTTSQF